MTETEMILTIAELKGKVNWMRNFLGEIRFVLDNEKFREDVGVNHILEVMEKLNIKEFPALNY